MQLVAIHLKKQVFPPKISHQRLPPRGGCSIGTGGEHEKNSFLMKKPSSGRKVSLHRNDERSLREIKLLPPRTSRATSLKDGGYYFPPQWSEARNHDAEHQFMTRQCQIMERSENSLKSLPPRGRCHCNAMTKGECER